MNLKFYLVKMKILILFIDMVRTEFLSIYNGSEKDTSIDVFAKRVGGTLYSNCYTPAPDTSRSNACLFTGLYPHFSGIDSRDKRPKDYIKSDVDTIFDKAIDRGFEINCFLTFGLSKWGLLKYKETNNVHIYNDMSKFSDVSSKANDKMITCIFNQDLHLALDDYGPGKKGHKEGYRVMDKFFKKYFTDENINKYDHVFVYSDHGLMVESEFYIKKTKLDLLKDGRTKILMFHHNRGDNAVKKDNRLSCIMDLYATIDNILGDNDYRHGIPFSAKPDESRIIHIEDHPDFKVAPNKIVNLWRVISNNFDIRTNIESVAIDRGAEGDLDEAMKHLRRYSPTIVEYEKFVRCLEFYSQMKQDVYLIEGEKRLTKYQRKFRLKIPVRLKKLFFIPYYRIKSN